MFAAVVITLPTRSYSTNRTPGGGKNGPPTTGDSDQAEGAEREKERAAPVDV